MQVAACNLLNEIPTHNGIKNKQTKQMKMKALPVSWMLTTDKVSGITVVAVAARYSKTQRCCLWFSFNNNVMRGPDTWFCGSMPVAITTDSHRLSNVCIHHRDESSSHPKFYVHHINRSSVLMMANKVQKCFSDNKERVWHHWLNGPEIISSWILTLTAWRGHE